MFIEGASRQPQSSSSSGAEAVSKSGEIVSGIAEVLSHEMPVLDTTTDIRGTVDQIFEKSDEDAHAIMRRICDAELNT